MCDMQVGKKFCGILLASVFCTPTFLNSTISTNIQTQILYSPYYNTGRLLLPHFNSVYSRQYFYLYIYIHTETQRHTDTES